MDDVCSSYPRKVTLVRELSSKALSPMEESLVTHTHIIESIFVKHI